MGRSGSFSLLRYDEQARKLIYQPGNWEKTNNQTTYAVEVHSGDRKAAYELVLRHVTPGDYVLDHWSAGTAASLAGNCFGAPAFHVDAGEVAYLVDFAPMVNVRLQSGARFFDLVYGGQSELAAQTLKARQPALVALERAVSWHAQATYACSAVTMTSLDLPGVDALPAMTPQIGLSPAS